MEIKNYKETNLNKKPEIKDYKITEDAKAD